MMEFWLINAMILLTTKANEIAIAMAPKIKLRIVKWWKLLSSLANFISRFLSIIVTPNHVGIIKVKLYETFLHVYFTVEYSKRVFS